MKKVTKEELAAMDADSDRCAAELADADVDVLGYACLVAIMSMGKGYHCDSETRLHEVTAAEGASGTGRHERGRAGRRPQDARRETDRHGRAVHGAADRRWWPTTSRHEGIEVVDRIALEIPG